MQQEQQDGPVVGLETREEGDDGRFAGQVHLDARLLQHAQRKEQEGKTEEEIADVAVLAQLDQDDAHEEGRPHHIRHVEGETGRHQHCHGSMIQDHQKQIVLLLIYFQKLSSSLTLYQSTFVIHLTTLPHPTSSQEEG